MLFLITWMGIGLIQCEKTPDVNLIPMNWDKKKKIKKITGKKIIKVIYHLSLNFHVKRKCIYLVVFQSMEFRLLSFFL